MILLFFWETGLTSLSVSLKCKPTDPLTKRANCTCLLGFRGRSLHGGTRQRPPEVWAAMQPPGPQARPRGASLAPGVQGQRPAGEPRGVAHALPAARSHWPCAPSRSGPGRRSRNTSTQAALTPHHHCSPRSPSHSSPTPRAGPGRPGAQPPKASGRGARPTNRPPGRTDRPTDRQIC